MPASEAQIRANRQNSLHSTGPRTTEDAAEVERMFRNMEANFRPTGDAGRVLVRRIATCAVRMERGVLQETAAINERVIKAQAEAVANGDDSVEAGHRAMFDPSKEAILARRYEAAAERGFFRALKELRQIETVAKGPDLKAEAAALRKQADQLASFLPAVDQHPRPARPAAATSPSPAKPAPKPARTPVKTVFPAWKPVFNDPVDVPITIGRVR